MPYVTVCLHVCYCVMSLTRQRPFLKQHGALLSSLGLLVLCPPSFFLSSFLSTTLQSTVAGKPRRHVFLVCKPAIKRESWGKYSSRTLKKAHLAIIYKWYVFCGQQRVELGLWRWLWEADVPELYGPALIRRRFTHFCRALSLKPNRACHLNEGYCFLWRRFGVFWS